MISERPIQTILLPLLLLFCDTPATARNEEEPETLYKGVWPATLPESGIAQAVT